MISLHPIEPKKVHTRGTHFCDLHPVFNGLNIKRTRHKRQSVSYKVHTKNGLKPEQIQFKSVSAHQLKKESIASAVDSFFSFQFCK